MGRCYTPSGSGRGSEQVACNHLRGRGLAGEAIAGEGGHPAGTADVEAQVLAALARSPDHPALLAALGGIRLQAGDARAAIDHLRRAAQLAPDDPRILADLGAALTAAGQYPEAEEVLRAAFATGADDNVIFNLARCLHLRGEHRAALEVLQRVAQPDGDVFKLHGDILRDVGEWRAAMQSYMLALQLDPTNAAYQNDLGVMLEMHGNPAEHRELWQQMAARPDAHAVVHFFLGNALRAEGDFAGARAAYEQASQLDPEMVEALNNLALVLSKLGQEEEAKAVFRRVMAIRPDLVEAQTNLGTLLSRSNALGEAEAMLARAVSLDPACTDARVNHGAVLMRQHRFAEAEAEFRRVLAEVPGHASAELNMGLLKLTTGELDLGWPYYESRWKVPQLAEKRPLLATPAWTGEPLDGKTLFVYSEQGFGDNLQFCRYLPELQRRYPSVRIVYYALHALSGLLAHSLDSAACRVLRWGEPIPEHDFNIALMSLPWRCATSLASIPARTPYLSVQESARARWQGRLAALPGLKAGLVWATSESFIYRSAKTVALSALAPLLEQRGVSWVNLQYGSEADEIAANGWQARFFDPMPEVRDFADTAAIVEQLDLVISVDTAVAHLAGAMNRPVWMIDRFDTDWRWLPPREDSPWYPSMRIIRQEEFGQWAPVVERVAAMLAGLAGS